MKHLLMILNLGILFYSLAEENPKGKEAPDYMILSNEIDESLWKKQAKITIEVYANDVLTTRSITYGYDDFSKSKELDVNNEFSFRIRPGEYEFAFFAEESFKEIFTKKINVEKQHHIRIRLNFKSSIKTQTVRKPIIYLYSDKAIDCDVTVKPKGEFTFTYPVSENGTWSLNVNDNGLTVNGDQYNYLFWEAEQTSNPIDYEYGVILNKNEVTQYLETSLDALGFKSEEKADFITYWAPQMISHDKIFLQFLEP